MIFDKDVLRLSQNIGNFIEYWGFRNVDGKIWLLIYLSNEPVDASVLIENLKVSKGLISTSIKTLLDHDLISEVQMGDNRSKYYQANFDPMKTIVNVLSKREKVLLSEVRESYEIMKKGSYEGVNPKRLKNVGSIIKFGSVLLNGIIQLRKLDLTPWK